MSILHHRRNVKRRFLEREASGERVSAPHMYCRASERDAPAPATAEPLPEGVERRRRPRRRKAKAKAKPKASA